MRVFPNAALGVDPLFLVESGHVSQTFLPFLVDIHHAAGSFEKLRQTSGVVADIVDQLRVARRWRAMPIRHQAIVILAVVRQVEANESVLAGDRIPLLPVVGRLDQRIGIVAQCSFVVGVLEFRRRNRLYGSVTPDPVVDSVGHQHRIDLAEIAVGAGSEKSQ